MRCSCLALAAVALVAGHGGHHDHHDDDDDHHHHDHGHDHGHEHEHPVELSATSWESTIDRSPYIWAVNFHSGMCSSCQAFKPEWEALTRAVDGLCVAPISNSLSLVCCVC
jgi:hypothetical protein